MEGAAGCIPKRTFGPGVGHALFPASSEALGHPCGRSTPTCVSKKRKRTSMAAEDTFDQLRIDLKLPLLIQRGSRGFLACGYINVETTNKTSEACAIVRGVNDFDDMLKAAVVAVSEEAQKLGVQVGMTGSEALELFR